MIPIYIERSAGVVSKHELLLTRAYLDEFRRIDNGRILADDRHEALCLDQRILREHLRRQLGDCLIRAMTRRLNHEVNTLDEGFPS